MTPLLEWSGCFIGLAGALLLALNNNASRYGWPVFLLANLVMIAFAISADLYGLMIQQIGFTSTSLLGIYRAKLLPSLSYFKRK